MTHTEETKHTLVMSVDEFQRLKETVRAAWGYYDDKGDSTNSQKMRDFAEEIGA